MANIGTLRTTVSLDDAQFKQGMQGINRQLRALKQEQRAVTSSGTGFARGLTEMRAKADVLTRTLELQRAKVQELRRRYEEARESTGEHAKETQNAQIQYQKAVAELNKTENALKNLTAEIERQANPWTRLGESMEEAGERLQTIGRGISDFGRSWTMRVTTPLLGVGAAALKVGMDFEAGMSQVQALSGATADELGQLSDMAKTLGETTRFSASEAADGMAFLAMAGFSTNQILDTMPGLLDLAASSNMELGRAADIATNILSAFGMEAAEAGRVADVLAAGASSANTSVEQLGGAMKYVAPVAASLGLEIEGMTAAVGLMSDAGIQGEQAGRQLRQGLLRLASPTGAAADLIEELGIQAFNADGSMKDLHEVVAELEKGLGDMDDQARTASLSLLFGAESVAGWTALLDRGSDELRDYTKQLENAEGAASEMASIMQDNAKGAMTEFRSALEGVGIALAEHMIPTVTDMIKKGTELVRKFGELDEGTQKNIIKMGLFAAAIGPAAIVVGNLTTSVGGFLTVGGKVASMLGAAGAAGKGTGLLGAIGALGPAKATPVGLAVLGLGALAVKAVDLYRNMRTLHDVSTETADAMMEQYLTNIEVIDSFDELRQKSRLTNDEFARYLDLHTLLESETDPQVIESITNEMEQLQQKSGLSNEELDKMVGYNNTLTETIPEATAQITEQGNRVADTTGKLKEYNQEIANAARRELEAELQKSLANELELREQIKEEQVELNRLTEIESGLRDIVKAKQDGTISTLKEKLELELESVDEAIREGRMRGEVSQELYNQRDTLDRLIALSDMELDTVRKTLSETISLVDEQRELVAKKEADLNKTGEIVAKMVEYELIAAGINEETARQVVQNAEVSKLLDDQLKALEDQKRELIEQTPEIHKASDGYKESVKQIDEQIKGLQTAKSNIQDLITEAGEYNKELAKDIDKSVRLQTVPTIREINREIAETVHKRVILDNRPQRLAYAAGTDYHPGGEFIAGEAGWELGRLGNRWEVLNAGIYNRPAGYQVFTHNESKRILRALNNIPAYATGARASGTADRVIGGLNSMGDVSAQMIALLRDIAQGIREGKVIQVDGREITQVVNENNAIADVGNYF